jgi:hypothetical protein
MVVFAHLCLQIWPRLGKEFGRGSWTIVLRGRIGRAAAHNRRKPKQNQGYPSDSRTIPGLHFDRLHRESFR